MKQIRYLKNIELLKSSRKKQPNGTYIDDYDVINKYNAQLNQLTDEVSASIYGTDVVKMLSVSTALKDLEKLLMTKLNNKDDNIALYYIRYNNFIYKVMSVSEKSIMVEMI